MSSISKTKTQKERLKSAIDGGGSSVGKLIQKPRKNDESKIQQACKRWFDMQHKEYARLLIAIPNGGKRSKITASILKAEGVVSGSPDMFLFVSRGIYFGLAIEMKTKEGGQSANQKLWQKDCEKQGYKYVICRSVDEFIKTIIEYL